jgi:hypothetical protein
MNPAIYDQTSVEITAKDYLFRASGRVLKFDGFLKVYEETADEDAKKPEDEEDITLPSLSQGELLRLLGITPKQHFTEPPPRYTEASLVKVLEEKGIGRPSTYATIPRPLGRVRRRIRQVSSDDSHRCDGHAGKTSKTSSMSVCAWKARRGGRRQMTWSRRLTTSAKSRRTSRRRQEHGESRKRRFPPTGLRKVRRPHGAEVGQFGSFSPAPPIRSARTRRNRQRRDGRCQNQGRIRANHAKTAAAR